MMTMTDNGQFMIAHVIITWYNNNMMLSDTIYIYSQKICGYIVHLDIQNHLVYTWKCCVQKSRQCHYVLSVDIITSLL